MGYCSLSEGRLCMYIAVLLNVVIEWKGHCRSTEIAAGARQIALNAEED